MDGKIKVQNDGNGVYQLDVAGHVDEDLEFPTDLKDVRSLSVDLGKVIYINSMGIRDWVRWINSIEKKAAGKLKLQLLKAPLVFIKAINVLGDVFPPYAEIKSFAYDAFCPTCNKEVTELIENKPGVTLPKLTCPNCKKGMQPQLPMESYETLLRKAQ
jgi:hypothetical protein